MYPDLIQEVRGGEPYAYYPLGDYVVAAPGICGGRPTFKGTRIEVAGALNLMAAGYSIDQIAQRFEVTKLAVAEALNLHQTKLQSILGYDNEI